MLLHHIVLMGKHQCHNNANLIKYGGLEKKKTTYVCCVQGY